MNHFRTHLAAVVAALALPVLASAQVPAAPVLQASATGQTVSASWTAVPGALAYRVEVGVTPSAMLTGQEVGPLTSFTLPNVPQGVYYLRVFARNVAGASAPSNVVGVQVVTAQGPPPAPANLTAAVNGSSVTFSAQLAPGLTGLVLVVGLAPGAAQGVLPLSVAAQNTLTGVPPGVYYARLVAFNAGGPSQPSNEVQVVVGPVACGPPAAPVVNAQASGTSVVLSWGAVPGAIGYVVSVAATPGGSPFLSQPLNAQTTSLASSGVPPGTYYIRVTAANACGLTATSAEVSVTATPPTPGNNRTPNPPPGQFLPLPDRWAVVQEVARQYAGDLQNSCVASGGNNNWLFRLVQRLRTEDTRWGLNWKRGRIGDMSQDILTYNFGSQADEGTREMYVLDVIGGHCGGAPGPSWNNVTGQGGADAIWTLQPYTAAGFPR